MSVLLCYARFVELIKKLFYMLFETAQGASNLAGVESVGRASNVEGD